MKKKLNISFSIANKGEVSRNQYISLLKGSPAHFGYFKNRKLVFTPIMLSPV